MEWKEVRLGDVIDYKKGFAFKSSMYKSTGTYIVRVSDTTANSVDVSLCNCISPELAHQYTDYSLKTKDIIIATVGSWPTNPASIVGKVVRVPESANNALLNQNAVRIRSNGIVDSDYLYYLLKEEHFSKYLVGTAQGSANQASITLKDIFGYSFSAPSEIKDQHRITSILSSLDRKIELNNKINADLEEMAQAIFKNWFVDFEPFKDGKFVNSELGMIPEGWKVGSLGDFCNVFTGKKNTNQAIEKGLYPFFSCAPEPLASNDAIFNGKAIIIAGNGSYTGRTSFYNGGFDLYQRTYACTIREQDKENLMIFFYHMMKQFFEPTKMGGTRGSSIPYIVMGDITQQKFPYSEDWLIRFSNIANSMMDRKLRIDKENSRLSLLRDTLLPRLMSGEIEVPE